MTRADTNKHCPWPALRMREWSSDRVYPVKPKDASTDTGANCQIRISGSMSLRARLTSQGQWWIEAQGSEPLWADGEPQTTFPVVPGMEIRVGAKLLVVESQREIDLRGYCQRLLGWGPDRQHAVDHALRSLRLARTRRAALMLQGDGDLVLIAHGLHRRVLGADAPFIVCDPRRTRTEASVRSPPNIPSAEAAVAAAAGGSVCVLHRRLPRDFWSVQSRLSDPTCDSQLYVCTENYIRAVAITGILPVEIPPLRLRETELPRVIEEYAAEAISAFDASPDCLTEEDRLWVHRYAQSLIDVEKATSRIVALRSTDTPSQAAALLGMASVSLSRWLARRPREGCPMGSVDAWTASD